MNPSNTTVIVTGATSGIGLALVQLLLKNGYRVVAAVRDTRRMHQLIVDAACSVVKLDLLDTPSIEAAAVAITEAAETDGVVLVNNAGMVVPTPIECSEAESVAEQFQVNVLGVIQLTNRLLPLLRRRKGRIINVGSISGEVAFPGLGVYAATKHALRAYTDALRLEMRGLGVACRAL